MRAAVLWERGGELEVRDDVELRELGPQDVRVRLAASGVCHTDVSVQAGTLAAEIPCVPGHEGAGTVTAVGPEVEGIRAGDPVILAAATGCLRCPSCLRGQTHLCRKGMGSWGPPADGSPAPFYSAGVNLPGYVGTFAEEIVVPQDCAVKIEPDVPLDVVALIGCCVVTGVGAALNTARIEPGSTVAVFGCGGIGSAAIQGARIAGAAEIVAVDPVACAVKLAKREQTLRGAGRCGSAQMPCRGQAVAGNIPRDQAEGEMCRRVAARGHVGEMGTRALMALGRGTFQPLDGLPSIER